MKTRLLMLIFVFSTISIMFSMPDVSACLCDELTVEQRINQADVVFSGTAKDNPWNFSDDSIATGFDVHRVWKGSDIFPSIKNGFVTVSTAKVSTACGVNFIQDKEYLIYGKIDGNNLQTTTCDGSWFLDGRADDVKELNAMGATHSFIDAREIKGSSSNDCTGPGLHSVEECEFGKLVRNVFLPLGIALPIVGISVFFIWRKRK